MTTGDSGSTFRHRLVCSVCGFASREYKTLELAITESAKLTGGIAYQCPRCNHLGAQAAPVVELYPSPEQ